MKKFMSILIVVSMLIGLLPAYGTASQNVLYDIDEFSEFPKLVRLTASEAFGIGGSSASDSCGKFQLNTEEKNGQYNGYFDLDWGKLTDGVWDKADYKGYLTTRFSVYTETVPVFLGLYTDGNADVSSNLKDLITLGEWNDILVVTDRSGGTAHGKTSTYINGKLAVDAVTDKLGQPHGTSSIKYHLRFLMAGAQGSVFYMDNVSVTESDAFPTIGEEEPPVEPEVPPAGDVITPVASDLSAFSANKFAKEDYSGSKYGRDNINCVYIEDNNTASDAFFQIGWTPKNTSSRYLVLNLSFAPNDKLERFYIGTNQNNAMSGVCYNGVQFAPYKWNRYTMVYDIVNNTSDTYINGMKIFDKASGKYVSGTSNCIRILMIGEGLDAYMNDLDVYECIDYPQIGATAEVEDCFDTDLGIHIDNGADIINTMGIKEASAIKEIFENADVRIYSDDTYSEVLGANDDVTSGAVVFAESKDKLFAYYNIGVYENNTVSVYSDSFNPKYNMLIDSPVNVIAPVTKGGVMATAQYDASGALIKLQLASGEGSTCISDIFIPEDTDNSTIKTLLWQDKDNIRPVGKKNEIKYTTGKTVCFLGDSITQKGKYIQEVYEYWCTDENAQPGLRMYNCGIPGDKTADALARIDEDCLSYDPDVTFVMLGTNDMNKNYFPLDADKFASFESSRNEIYATYRANMKSIIERLTEYGSKVILMAPVPYDDVSDGTTQRNVGIRKCGEIVRELAEEYNLDYIDMYEGMKELKWSDYYYADMVHPSERGHHVMAQIILKHYGCVEEIDTGDYIRDFTTANAMRYEKSYYYRFVKHIDYSAGYRGLTLAEKKAKALKEINTTTDSNTKMRYTLYYDNIETIDKMNEELIGLTIETSLKK